MDSKTVEELFRFDEVFISRNPCSRWGLKRNLPFPSHWMFQIPVLYSLWAQATHSLSIS